MPQRCKICSNPKRAEIDAALVSQPMRGIAKQYGVSESSIFRHTKKHVKHSLGLAIQARDLEIGESVLEGASQLYAIASKILKKAEGSGEHELALKAIKELRGILEFLLKIMPSGKAPAEPIKVVYIDRPN